MAHFVSELYEAWWKLTDFSCMYKALHGLAPPYLSDDCLMVAEVGRRLWSADARICVVPRTRTQFGDRSFAVAGPRVWNSLLAQLRDSNSICSFRKQLKTHGHWFVFNIGGRQNFEILYAKPCILRNICEIIGPQNGSILLCWILMLRCFWINFLTKQLYNVGIGRYWRNRKGIYAKLAFIITENVHKLLVLWQNIGGEITYRVPQTNYWRDMSPLSPRFRRLCEDAFVWRLPRIVTVFARYKYSTYLLNYHVPNFNSLGDFVLVQTEWWVHRCRLGRFRTATEVSARSDRQVAGCLVEGSLTDRRTETTLAVHVGPGRHSNWVSTDPATYRYRQRQLEIHSSTCL